MKNWQLTLFFLLLSYCIFPQKFLAEAHNAIVVIRMTAAGFEPTEVTVDENASINFVNEDTVDRWPASDLHPTHEVFPEFDPQKPIKPKEIWLFTPKKVGKWKFHDHLLPHKKGLITVVKEDVVTAENDTKTPLASEPSPPRSPKKDGIWEIITSFINQTLTYFVQGIAHTLRVELPQSPTTSTAAVKGVSTAEFKKLPESEQFQHLKNQAKVEGSDAVWKFIVATYQGESGTQGNIHDLAHLAGQLLFAEKGFPGLSVCSVQYAFGCFHGFLDSAFKNSLDKLTEAEVACQKLGSGMSGPVASCIHGIGHGVASFYKTTDLKQALISCDRLTTPAQPYCYDGVFMEFERNAPSTFYKADELLYPCSELDSRYAFSCGRNQPQVLLQRFKKNYIEVVDICIKSAVADFKAACFDALGFIAAAQGQGNPQQVVGLCQNITTSEFQNHCLKAAAGEIIFQEMPNWYQTAPQVCAGAETSFQAECQGYIQHLMEDYGRIRPQSQGESPAKYIQSQMGVCLKIGGQDGCYKKVAEFLSSQFGLKKSLELLKSNEEVPAVYARCHEVTHYLSRFEYEKNKSVPKTYAQCDSTCHGGCYHGTLEAYLKEKQISVGDDNRITEAMTSVCGKLSDYQSSLVYYECLHGLGHAGMFITDMEVPQSLKLCDALENTGHRERCYSGVFMENSSSSTSTDHPGKYVKADDPLYPCNSIEEKYQQLCYRYQSSHFALITRHDWKAVADLCLKVPEQYQRDCFRTVGTNQVGFTQEFSVMRNNCAAMPSAYQGICFAGVIGSLAYRFVGNITKMVEFCSMIPSDHQQVCLQNIGTSIIDWASDTTARENFCLKTGNSQFTQWCKQGIVSSQNQTGANQVFN